MSRRRRKSTTAEDIISVVSLLPWWGALLLGVVSYVVFHALLLQKPPPVTQTGEVISHAFLTPFYAAGQIIAPLLCVIAAAVSFARSRHRGRLFQSVATSQAADAVNQLSWQEFEQLVGQAFKLDGYSVVENGGGGPDGGVDLVLRRGNEKFLVQCKQWKAFKVGVDVVRELYGLMAARGATGGFVVTSGTFSNDAEAFAQGRNIRLLDGPKLHALLQGVSKGKDFAPYPTPVSSPACPLCGSRMVRRTAKRGQHAGSEFWGCQRYPECKGIVE